MSEWGPWVEHDGKGCPVQRGELIEIEGHKDSWGSVVRRVGRVTEAGWGHRAWTRKHSRYGNQIIRYRIRKPRGLTMLEDLIADLPAPVTPKVNA